MCTLALKEAGSAHYYAMERQEVQSWWSITDHPRARRCLCHVIGAMYQDSTEKSVETKCEISQRTFTLLGGEPHPLFGGKMWPNQKNPSGAFIKKNKLAPLVDPLFGGK